MLIVVGLVCQNILFKLLVFIFSDHSAYWYVYVCSVKAAMLALGSSEDAMHLFNEAGS